MTRAHRLNLKLCRGLGGACMLVLGVAPGCGSSASKAVGFSFTPTADKTVSYTGAAQDIVLP